jgi:hypothetical protein
MRGEFWFRSHVDKSVEKHAGVWVVMPDGL